MKFYTPSEVPHDLSTTKDRVIMLQSAREEKQSHISKMHINRALKHSVPASTDIYYQPE